MINSSTNIIETIAGNGIMGYAGIGGLAIDAEIYGPAGIAIDSKGNIYFCSYGNSVILMVYQFTPPSAFPSFITTNYPSNFPTFTATIYPTIVRSNIPSYIDSSKPSHVASFQPSKIVNKPSTIPPILSTISPVMQSNISLNTNQSNFIILVAVLGVLLLIVLFLFCYCYSYLRKTKNNNKSYKSNTNTNKNSEGFELHDIYHGNTI